MPTLDRLAEIIAGGGGGSARWFPDTYNVYHSLYVDGPARSLSFAYASAPTTMKSTSAGNSSDDNNNSTTITNSLDGGGSNSIDAVTVLSFDLMAMGAERLFNGQWHHTALLLLAANGRARAQLSSDHDPDWGRCVSTFPKPIAAAPTAALSANATRVGNAQSDRVSGGMLVVGYFNGGVGLLRAHPRRVSATDLLPYGTQTMRDANAFPHTKTLGMGCALIAAAAVLLIACAVVGCRDVKQMRAAASAASYRELSDRLFAHFCAATDHEQRARLAALSASEQTSDRDRRVAPLVGEVGGRVGELDGYAKSRDALVSERTLIAVLQYHPIRLWTALRWSGLSPSDLSLLLDEVESQVAGGAPEKGRAVLTLLYQLKTRSPDAADVSDSMWNCIAQADANSPADAASAQCCGGDDLFKKAVAAERARRRKAFVEAFGASSKAFDGAGGDVLWLNFSDGSSSSSDGDEWSHRRRRSSFSAGDEEGGDEVEREMRPVARRRGKDGPRGTAKAEAEVSKGDHTIAMATVGVELPVKEGVEVSSSIPPPPAIADVSRIAAPFTSAMQSVSVWAASLTLPSLYPGSFSGLFSFLSLELSSVFAGLPSISTPIIQVAARHRRPIARRVLLLGGPPRVPNNPCSVRVAPRRG